MRADRGRWPLVILGCGYTGRHVARLFLSRGHQVLATTRTPARLDDLARAGALVFRFEAGATPIQLQWVPQGSRLLYSIPPQEADPDPLAAIVQALESRVERAVYLSTSGVYGTTLEVNEHTPPAPPDETVRRRLLAEQTFTTAHWSSMILRPAAIYGPGRGVHVRMARGDFRLVDGGLNYVSRIHVEDLARITAAALDADLEGVWPVADSRPCTSLEIAAYCARLLTLQVPDSVPAAGAHPTRRANRRVDGSAVLRELEVSLLYPTYEEGIPASLAAEGSEDSE
jgi:nucleoside-diphosphate-sugar epimerase